MVDTAQPGWRGLNSSSSQVNKPAESRCKAYQPLVDSVSWIHEVVNNVDDSFTSDFDMHRL